MKAMPILLLILSLALISCGSESPSQDNSNLSEHGENSNLSLIFKDSGFNQYINFSEDNHLIRFGFGFFPDGTNFDFTNKRVILPCDVPANLPEGVDVNLNAPLSQSACSDPLVINIENEDESLTVEGVVLKADRDLFSSRYGFIIGTDGIKNSTTLEVLQPVKGKMVDYITKN